MLFTTLPNRAGIRGRQPQTTRNAERVGTLERGTLENAMATGAIITCYTSLAPSLPNIVGMLAVITISIEF